MSPSLGSAILFWVLALYTLGFGVAVVRARNLFKAAVSLAFCLLGVAGVFLMLGAHFLAGVQVLLYIGAVTTLLIFAVMVTTGMGSPQVRQFNRQHLPGAIVVVTAVIALSLAIVNAALIAAPALSVELPGLPELGTEILIRYVLPFDVATVLLLVAMVGAVILARKE